jgi:hypothetical protein
MDISVYISELLFTHNCVIIPGFGGFVGNYLEAQIHPILHTVSPPSKAISFNRSLKNNDGLLVNHIALQNKISYDQSLQIIATWVSSANHILKAEEMLPLKHIGKLYPDAEKNLQFVPDESINYLKSSFGLRVLIAEPVLREKEIEFTEKFIYETKNHESKRTYWRMAAAIFLVAALTTLLQLMWHGVEIKSLELNEANIYGLLANSFHAVPAAELKTIPIETSPAVVPNELVSPNVTTEITYTNNVESIQNTTGETFYIIIGAFTKTKNISAAKTLLEETHAAEDILLMQENGLTRVGYSVGSNMEKAKEQLAVAQSQNTSYWLLKK